MQHFLDRHTTHPLSLENSSRQVTCMAEIAHFYKSSSVLSTTSTFFMSAAGGECREEVWSVRPLQFVLQGKLIASAQKKGAQVQIKRI